MPCDKMAIFRLLYKRKGAKAVYGNHNEISFFALFAGKTNTGKTFELNIFGFFELPATSVL